MKNAGSKMNKIHRYVNTVITIGLIILGYKMYKHLQTLETEVQYVNVSIEECQDNLYEKITGRKLSPEDRTTIRKIRMNRMNYN
jgi:hypothetical protein